LLRKDFFEEFCREFAKEMNQLRMEQGASITSAKRELARIEARRKKLIDLVLDDQLPANEVKDELNANANRRPELEAQLKVADEPPPSFTQAWLTSTARRSRNSPPPSSSRTRAWKRLRCSVG
jgi:hypothetical protein